MSELQEKMFQSQSGDISYFYHKNKDNSERFILYIHGSHASKHVIATQFERYELDQYSWIVPDLLGYGYSDRPQDENFYSLRHHAQLLYHLCQHEHISSLVIIGHSIGTAIGALLLELLQQTNVIIATAFVILEGAYVLETTPEDVRQRDQSYDEYVTEFSTFNAELRSNPDKFSFPEWAQTHQFSKLDPFAAYYSMRNLNHLRSNSQLFELVLKQTEQLKTLIILAGSSKGTNREKYGRQLNGKIIDLEYATHSVLLSDPEPFWKEFHAFLKVL